MKILLIASTDSYNFSLGKLYTCFKTEGHYVSVLKTEYGKEHNFAVRELPAKTYLGAVKDLKSYDFAVFENVLNTKLLNQLHEAGIFCVSMYFHAYPTEYVLGSGFLYGNLTFSLGENFKKAQQRNGVVQEIIPIGSPQYDDIKLCSQVDGNVLLFLEQHFYPAGDKGKNQLATMLLETALKNPDYKIIVKPRSLPQFHQQSKHKSKHLYSYIEKLAGSEFPNNLVLLKEHRDLLSLIDQSSVVATTFSTAIYPCLIANKPVIWVTGFDSQNIHYYNRKVIESYYSQYEDTGNVVHYGEFKDFLKKATAINKELVDNIIYKPDKHAGERIVEVLEYIYNKVLVNNRLLPYLDITYETYKQKIDWFVSNDSVPSNRELAYAYQLNKEYNTSLDQFYRLYMTAGYSHKEVFTELKKKLADSRNKYVGYADANHDKITSFRKECSTITDKYINSYATVLENNNGLTEDFKSSYIRWLYDNSSYSELLSLKESFYCVDLGLYAAMVKYKTKQLNSREIIAELTYYKKLLLDSEFPYTLFYSKTTLNEIEKQLIIAYYKNRNLIKFILAIFNFLKTNRDAVVKKLTSNIYRILSL